MDKGNGRWPLVAGYRKKCANRECRTKDPIWGQIDVILWNDKKKDPPLCSQFVFGRIFWKFVSQNPNHHYLQFEVIPILKFRHEGLSASHKKCFSRSFVHLDYDVTSIFHTKAKTCFTSLFPFINSLTPSDPFALFPSLYNIHP